MKNALSENILVPSWSIKIETAERKALREDILSLEERNADGTMNEMNHFMMQCVRIPVNDLPSERKIMQVALNIGQLLSEIHLVELDEKMASLFARFTKFGMTELSAYID